VKRSAEETDRATYTLINSIMLPAPLSALDFLSTEPNPRLRLIIKWVSIFLLLKLLALDLSISVRMLNV